MGRRNFEVLQIGPLPPPIGGVSSHVHRLASHLRHRGIDLGIANHFHGHRTDDPVVCELHRNPLRYLFALRRLDAAIVHYHYSRPSTLMAVAIALPSRDRRATLVTVHGHGLTRLLKKRGSPRAWLARRSLKRFAHVVAVSDPLRFELREALPSLPISTIPAFIPATGDSEPDLSEEAQRFLGHSGHTLVASAYRVSFLFGDRDDYGIDTAVELLIRLAPSIDDLRLAIFLAMEPTTPKQTAYLARIRRRVAEAGIEDRFSILVDEPLTAAFESGCVYLRPTRTDGDAVSVREALAAGVPVIASDVTHRPTGTVTLPAEDIYAWAREATNAVGETSVGIAEPGPRNEVEPIDSLLALYSRHAGEGLAARLVAPMGRDLKPDPE